MRAFFLPNPINLIATVRKALPSCFLPRKIKGKVLIRLR